MNIYWIFISIICFCMYIFFGLYMIEGMETLTQKILTWVIYSILWATFINVFSLSYFWSVIRTKIGPYGIRGPEGETGIEGTKGECGISASQAYCMKSLNDYINDLYKSNTNKDILNDDTQKFPCVYLNEKIQKMASSRQYQVLVGNASNNQTSINNIVNYLKSIWKEWFDLIYNATSQPGAWFIDEFGDENYSWVGNNPFDEIKKYDIFYWGVTRDFRPLKAEICRSSATYNSSKLPQHNLPQKPRLKIIQSNDYNKINDDAGHKNAKYDGSWWRPKVATIDNETYYPVGDVLILQHGINRNGKVKVGNMEWSSQDPGPDIKTILVSGDVKTITGFRGLVWHGGDDSFGSAALNCPEGYVDMGNISYSKKFPRQDNKSDPNWGKYDSNDARLSSPFIDEIKCVPKDCVEPITNEGYGLWESYGWQYVLNDYRMGNNEATGDNGYNLMRVQNSNQPFYKIKEKCLTVPKTNPPSTKEVDPKFSESGIGWNGHPYKLDPKYSIFSFLNLVPEGMIVNKATGQRFYITHYGGEDVNIYNILVYRKSTNKYNYALQISNNNVNQDNFEDNLQIPTDSDSDTKSNTDTKSNSDSNTDSNTDSKTNTFLISHANGKFISYDNKTNKLSLNSGKQLMIDIGEIKDTTNLEKQKNQFENIQEDVSVYSKDNYFINKAYYIENNNKIYIETFLNTNINNNNNNNNNDNNNNNKWNIIANPDKSVKIVNNSDKYIGYDDTKDTVILVKENDNKKSNWYLNIIE